MTEWTPNPNTKRGLCHRLLMEGTTLENAVAATGWARSAVTGEFGELQRRTGRRVVCTDGIYRYGTEAVGAQSQQPARAPLEPKSQSQKKLRFEKGSTEAGLLTHFPADLVERERDAVESVINSIGDQIQSIMAAHVRQEAERRAHEIYGKLFEEAKTIIGSKFRQFPFSKKEHGMLIMVSHPDNAASAEMRSEVFQMLRKRERLLCPEKDPPRRPPLPSRDELMARRQKADEEKRKQRVARKGNS